MIKMGKVLQYLKVPTQQKPLVVFEQEDGDGGLTFEDRVADFLESLDPTLLETDQKVLLDQLLSELDRKYSMSEEYDEKDNKDWRDVPQDEYNEDDDTDTVIGEEEDNDDGEIEEGEKCDDEEEKVDEIDSVDDGEELSDIEEEEESLAEYYRKQRVSRLLSESKVGRWYQRQK